MKHFKTLCLIATAAAALAIAAPASATNLTSAALAIAAPASATNLTSPKGTTYTGAIKATSGAINLTGSFVKVECTKSTVEMNTEQHGSSITVGGKLTKFSFEGCNYEVTVLKAGSAEGHTGGTVTSSGAEVSLHTSVGTCIFTTNSTDVGTGTGGTPAVFEITSSKIPRTGGNFLCGSSGTVNGFYTINTPGTLFLD